MLCPVEVQVIAAAVQGVGVVELRLFQLLQRPIGVDGEGVIVAALVHLHRVGTQLEHAAVFHGPQLFFLIDIRDNDAGFYQGESRPVGLGRCCLHCWGRRCAGRDLRLRFAAGTDQAAQGQ